MRILRSGIFKKQIAASADHPHRHLSHENISTSLIRRDNSPSTAPISTHPNLEIKILAKHILEIKNLVDPENLILAIRRAHDRICGPNSQPPTTSLDFINTLCKELLIRPEEVLFPGAGESQHNERAFKTIIAYYKSPTVQVSDGYRIRRDPNEFENFKIKMDLVSMFAMKVSLTSTAQTPLEQIKQDFRHMYAAIEKPDMEPLLCRQTLEFLTTLSHSLGADGDQLLTNAGISETSVIAPKASSHHFLDALAIAYKTHLGSQYTSARD